jgi:recombination protein RecT
MATAIATRSTDPIAVVRQNLTQMAPQFAAALPKHISVEKFTRVALTAIQNNPDLAVKADRRSLFGACVRLAQDGLLPDGREAAIVMFGDKAQAMPMIAGILRKVRQSGEVSRVSAQVVYRGRRVRLAARLRRGRDHMSRRRWISRAARRSAPMRRRSSRTAPGCWR